MISYMRPSVNSSPKFSSQLITSLDFGVSLVFDRSVNPPLTFKNTDDDVLVHLLGFKNKCFVLLYVPKVESDYSTMLP